MKEPLIVLTDLSKSFDEEMILNHIDLTIYKKEFLTLLGPSGCGKTTTLRIIGGFTTPDSGKVEFDGKDITALPPYKREVNTVFQKYALFPNMNVAENIAFGLRLKKKSNAEIEEKVKKMLSLVNLSGFEKRYIEQLSGGQQQRVAIARALVNEPKVLLLDEPLGALDLKLRKEMQIELKSIQQRLGITFIYVTHDQEEALSMSDSIAVMKDGVIQQYGTPEDIYNEPENAFVADFIGESNIVPGRMEKDFEVAFENQTFTCVDPRFPETERVEVVVRPEDIKMTAPSDGMLKGVVQSVVFKGVHFEMIVRVGETEWMLHNTKSAALGDEIGLNIYPDDIHIMRCQEA